MVGTIDSKVDPVDDIELIRWFDWARRPWGPLMAAERQFDALMGDSGGDAPCLAAYDQLFDLAHRAIRWLEHNACPDPAFGRQVKAEMMAYRSVADSLRSTILADEGHEMVAQLNELQDVIDRHVQEIDDLAPTDTHALPATVRVEAGSTVRLRRRVPRQPTRWDAMCHIEGECGHEWRACRVVDISMLGAGITLNCPSPSHSVARRILVDVAAGEVSIRLEGKITNAKLIRQGTSRLGVEFDLSSESEPGTAADQSALSKK
jgi:hypothetical protein